MSTTVDHYHRKPMLSAARRAALVLLAAVSILGVMPGSSGAAPGDGETTIASVDSSEVQGNSFSDSTLFSTSADGRFVAFRSSATNLVAGDTNGTSDVFVRDRQTGTTERVSVDGSEAQGNGNSYQPSVSADGRFVAFTSDSSNLVANDDNKIEDVFVRDRQAGTTERASIGDDEAQGDGFSILPSISADGRFVAFASEASNLVANDDTNVSYDVFVRDRQLGTTELISVGASGDEGNGGSVQPSISADGRFVAFHSFATDLTADDTNRGTDIFVRDRQLGTTELASVDTSGDEGNGASTTPSVSADGRFVAFASLASDLVAGDTNGNRDVFVRDRQAGTTERVSVEGAGAQGNGNSFDPSVSADGRFVAFASLASDLAADDTNDTRDIFARDRQAGTTELISVGASGDEGNDASVRPSTSADGRFVAFTSAATNLVANDGNDKDDVFVRELNINTAPVATADAYAATEDRTLDVPRESGVLANDADPDADTLTAELVEDAFNGKVTLGSDGSFTYTPDKDFFGNDFFTYKASDGRDESGVVRARISVAPADEPAPPPALSVSDVRMVEGDPGDANEAIFTVTRTGDASGASSASFATSDGSATAGEDYQQTNGTVEFAAGETRQEIKVPILGDNSDEPSSETFTVALSGASSGTTIEDGEATGTIFDDDDAASQPPTGDCTKTGTAGSDRLSGTASYDRLCARAGDDTVKGLGDPDVLLGEEGNDALYGGNDNDRLDGGPGRDGLYGGRGDNDEIQARDGEVDVVDCGAGKNDVAVVDRNDKVKNCETVRRSS